MVNAGGLPGFAPLWQGGDYDDLQFLSQALTAIQERGHQAVLDKAWIAMHNYNLSEPVAGNLNSDRSGNLNSDRLQATSAPSPR